MAGQGHRPHLPPLSQPATPEGYPGGWIRTEGPAYNSHSFLKKSTPVFSRTYISLTQSHPTSKQVKYSNTADVFGSTKITFNFNSETMSLVYRLKTFSRQTHERKRKTNLEITNEFIQLLVAFSHFPPRLLHPCQMQPRRPVYS